MTPFAGEKASGAPNASTTAEAPNNILRLPFMGNPPDLGFTRGGRAVSMPFQSSRECRTCKCLFHISGCQFPITGKGEPFQ